MAKDKTKKKTVDEIKIIESFEKNVYKYSEKTNFIKSVNIEEEVRDDNLRYVAVLDCGSFTQRIIYYPEILFSDHFIDTEFSFSKSGYTYSFYDIFNLFDIEDFELYYYKDIIASEEVENAVKSILEATEEYLYYLEKAGASAYLSDLEKNYETDMDNCNGSSDWREEKDDEDSFLVPNDNHIIFTFADGNMNDKAIKKLKKKNEKGKLDTIYEKRLLKYIEAGNKIVRKNVSYKEEFEKLYSKKSFLVHLIIFAVCFVCITALSSAAHAYIFKGAETIPAIWGVLGIKTTLPLGRLGTCLLAAIALVIEINMLFGKKLVVKSMPEDMKNLAAETYQKDACENPGKFDKVVKVIFVIVLPIVVICSFLTSFDDVGYYETYVKYSCNTEFKIVDVNYEDLEIYKVKYDYDEDEEDEFVETENYYAISDGKGNYYDYGELEKGGKTETKLKEIAEKYNKEIVEIDSVEELY